MKVYQKKFGNEFATIFYNESRKEISCDCLAGMAFKGLTPKDRTPDGLPRHSEKICLHAKDFYKQIKSGNLNWKDVSPDQ